MEQEIWLPIPRYPLYEASTFGNIKSTRKNKILRFFKRDTRKKDGPKKPQCCTIGIRNEYGVCTFSVHYLVMSAFRPNTIPGLTIDHIDRNPFNNRLNNLRWATKKEQNDNTSGKRRKEIKKILPRELHKIFLRTKQETVADIAKEYSISRSDLWKLLRYVHPLY